MLLRKRWAYGRNVTEAPQTLRHPLLEQLAVVPVMPGGFVPVVSGRAEIAPGQCFRVPIAVWTTSPAVWRASWAVEITEEEFLQAGPDLAELQAEIDRLQRELALRDKRIAELGALLAAKPDDGTISPPKPPAAAPAKTTRSKGKRNG